MEILKHLINDLPEIPIKRFSIGVFNVAVESCGCGISTTVIGDTRKERGITAEKNLLQLSLRELAEYIFSDNTLEASLGMAAINSFYNRENRNYRNINLRTLLVNSFIDKNIAFIGSFPFIPSLKKDFPRITVFDLQPQVGEFSADDIPKLLPRAEVVVVTSSTLINHTFANVIEHVSPEAFTIMVGPSAPLTAKLSSFRIDAVCGVTVHNCDLLFQQVSQGITHRRLQAIEQVCLFIKKLRGF